MTTHRLKLNLVPPRRHRMKFRQSVSLLNSKKKLNVEMLNLLTGDILLSAWDQAPIAAGFESHEELKELIYGSHATEERVDERGPRWPVAIAARPELLQYFKNLTYVDTRILEATPHVGQGAYNVAVVVYSDSVVVTYMWNAK